MSNNPTERRNGFNAGVRACVTWLHRRADSMNDPHARAILNSAAFDIGRDGPAGVSPSDTGSGDEQRSEPNLGGKT